MYVAAVIQDHGHRLEPSGDEAPDLKVRQRDGSVMWIEVTTAESGEGANRAARIIQQQVSSTSYMYQLDENKMILRYQNAIRQKVKQREEFIQRGSVKNTDSFVIALNAGEIDDADLDDGLPHIVRAVYPLGELQFIVRVKLNGASLQDDPDEENVRWPIQTSIKTPKGIDASTSGFVDGAYAGVSAVLFSPHAIWNSPIPGGREFTTVYNQTASVPLPLDTFPFGESFHGDGTTLHRKQWTP